MKRARAHLRLLAKAPAALAALSRTQAENLRSFAAALDMDEPELIRAVLADDLPTLLPDNCGGDLAALVASEPLYVVCGNRQKEAEFHARLERAARYFGCASAEDYVARIVHLGLWSDEREMIVHPRTGQVIGSEPDWRELRFCLEGEALPVAQAEAA